LTQDIKCSVLDLYQWFFLSVCVSCGCKNVFVVCAKTNILWKWWVQKKWLLYCTCFYGFIDKQNNTKGYCKIILG